MYSGEAKGNRFAGAIKEGAGSSKEVEVSGAYIAARLAFHNVVKTRCTGRLPIPPACLGAA